MINLFYWINPETGGYEIMQRIATHNFEKNQPCRNIYTGEYKAIPRSELINIPSRQSYEKE